jgi:hypothetical protein
MMASGSHILRETLMGQSVAFADALDAAEKLGVDIQAELLLCAELAGFDRRAGAR